MSKSPTGILLLSYDTEYGVWADIEITLSAVKAITTVHDRFDAPATFFICGKLLEERGPDFKRLLDCESLDIQSHTYSHRNVLRDVTLDELVSQLDKTKKLIGACFGRTVTGFRTPGGHYKGLQGHPDVIKVIWESGVRFVSSDLRGERHTFPSAFNQPYWYDDDGFPEMLEIPSQGWPDNALKAIANAEGEKSAKYLMLWPSPLPWPHPENPPSTLDEEFAIYKQYLDYACDNGLIFSPAFHPWSLWAFHKQAGTIDRILTYATQRNMEIIHYLDLYRRLTRDQPTYSHTNTDIKKPKV